MMTAVLEKKFLEQIVLEEPWKIAIQLNLLESDVGSRVIINNKLEEYGSELKSVLGDEKFKDLNGVAYYVNSMLLDFDRALSYSLIENKKESLIELQENALLYGRSQVVSSLNNYGRNNNIPELIIDKSDMQNFLIYHALPQIRLCQSPEKLYSYSIEEKTISDILDKIAMDKKHAIKLALDLLEDKNTKNVPRKLIFSKILGDNRLIDRYTEELKELYFTPRDGIDALVKERAFFLSEGDISRLQYGDENPIFPIASNIFLVDKNTSGRKVWKEDLKLYTDFSRLDGYSSEKEILSRLDHPNIIKLLGTFTEKNIHFLELEYARGKSLDKYLKRSDIPNKCSEDNYSVNNHSITNYSENKYPENTLTENLLTENIYFGISEKEALGITITLCDVLDYLHSKNIVYMDMKKKNVMYNRPEEAILQSRDYDLESIAKNVKLIDFGMSQKVEHLTPLTTLTTLLSTPEYLAPELTGCRAYIATDTFQLGLLLHDLLYKKHAFIDTSDVSLRLKEGDEYRESEIIMYGLAVKYGNYHASKDEYGNLLSRMLEKDPSKRPDLTYVKNKLMNIYNSKFYSEHKEPVSVPISSTNSLAMISTCVPVNISANPHEVKV